MFLEINHVSNQGLFLLPLLSKLAEKGETARGAAKAVMSNHDKLSEETGNELLKSRSCSCCFHSRKHDYHNSSLVRTTQNILRVPNYG